MPAFLLLEAQEPFVPRLFELLPELRARRRALAAAAHRFATRREYLELSFVAEHLVDAYAGGSADALPRVFRVVERVLERGDPSVSELAIWGLLEDLQRAAASRLVDPDVFLFWLGPRSQRAWDEIARGWGERPALMATLRLERRRL